MEHKIITRSFKDSDCPHCKERGYNLVSIPLTRDENSNIIEDVPRMVCHICGKEFPEPKEGAIVLKNFQESTCPHCNVKGYNMILAFHEVGDEKGQGTSFKCSDCGKEFFMGSLANKKTSDYFSMSDIYKGLD